MATKNIYSEVVESYNRLCNKVCDILDVSWNYWNKLKEKIENIYDTEISDESERLTDSASKYLENLYCEEDDDGTVLFEKLGFKDLVDEAYLEGNWSNIREDFAITIIGTSKNYIKVKLYGLCDEGNTTSLKIPVKYLQSENYKELIKAKYEAIDKEIDKRTKKKSDKSNKIKEITSPKIELKEKLEKHLKENALELTSEKQVYKVADDFIKNNSLSYKETCVGLHYENNMLAVAYRDTDSCAVKMFMIPVSIVGI